MSGRIDDDSDPEARVAEAFDRDGDSLAVFEDQFEAVEIDPFEVFVVESVEPRDVVESTVEGYRRTHRQWRQFMGTQERHPAYPAERHVTEFIEHLSEQRKNRPNTVQAKLRQLNETYRLWQQAPAFPHPTDFNPIALAMSKVSVSASTD